MQCRTLTQIVDIGLECESEAGNAYIFHITPLLDQGTHGLTHFAP